jgi:hypothetical protein
VSEVKSKAKVFLEKSKMAKLEGTYSCVKAPSFADFYEKMGNTCI